MQNLAVGGLRAARTQPFLAKPEKEEGASGQAPVVPGRYLLEGELPPIQHPNRGDASKTKTVFELRAANNALTI